MREKLAITMAQQVCRDDSAVNSAEEAVYRPELGRDLRKVYFELDKTQGDLRRQASSVEGAQLKRGLTSLQERIAILKIDLLELIQNTNFDGK